MSDLPIIRDPFASQRAAHEQGRVSSEGPLPTFEKSKGKRRRPSHKRHHVPTKRSAAGGKYAKKYKGRTCNSDFREKVMQLIGGRIGTGVAANHADRTCEYVPPKVKLTLAPRTHGV